MHVTDAQSEHAHNLLYIPSPCTVSFSPVCVIINTSVKIIKNEVGCRDDTVPKTVETRRHCEEY